MWAVLLILVFALMLGIFPATATAPPGSGFFDQLYYLILPAICLVFVLFGYIARMARAGTIESLDADYTRTAIIKGLPRRTVVRAPRAAQLAAADDRRGGHAARVPDRRTARDRDDLQLQRDRPGAVRRPRRQKDFPLLQSGVLIVGVVYLVATLLADIAYSVLNPRVRLGSEQ